MKEFAIVEKPFSWNDNFSEIALEDFSMIQKSLSYGTAQNIGMALAKLQLLEEIGASIWIPCSERLPDNETEVEICCVRKYIGAGDEKKVCRFTARAFYTDGTMTTEDSSYVWEDCDNWEYNEEKDAYIIPEGWWECVTFSEQFGVVDAEVIAWMPLPEPFRKEGAK